MTTTPRNATPARRRSRLTGAALAVIGAAVSLAACTSDPATNTAQTTTPVAQKSAGAAGSNFQFRVANATDQAIPVRLCYAEINADSCVTVNVTKDKPTDPFIHSQITGVVGKIPENVPSGTPVGVSFHLFEPGLGTLPRLDAASAAFATSDLLRPGLDTYALAFPAAPSNTQFFSLSDDDSYSDFTIKDTNYHLRINRKGDATPGGDKVVWLTILAVIPPAAPATTTTTTSAP